MPESLIVAAYLIAGILFILSLRGLSAQSTARGGNVLGIIGMALAVGITAVGFPPGGMALGLLGAAAVGGAIIGALLAARVEMTSMPQLVAVLHSFVGAAAMLVGMANFLGGLTPDKVVPGAEAAHAAAAHGGVEQLIHYLEIFIGVFIGAVTFTGSLVAYGKLEGKIRSKPLLLPGRHVFNLALLAVSVALGVAFVTKPELALTALLVMTALACILGVHLVMAIGGADMPVVVSMLNSYSGWAAAAAGFMLKNDLLIITGALVGSSGAILSYIMCKAMNRSFLSVIFGGFGADEGAAPAKTAGAAPQGEVQSVTAEGAAEALREARTIIVVPGYGMAVAHAQHPLHEIASLLRKQGKTVRFAIHPVAGRLPGHMNVLLAEAKVPYDIVLEMDEINQDFPTTDVTLVIGANDIVNPGALDDASSPIYGMPVLECWKGKQTLVFKRSMASGYAGVENPLFFRDNTRMVFGDAKKSVDGILQALRASESVPVGAK